VVEAVVIRVLRGLAAVVSFCAAPALAAIDCDRARNLALEPGTHAVIAYVDAGNDTVKAFERMRGRVQSAVLSDYLKPPAGTSPPAAKLIFVISQRPRPVIDRDDIKKLMGSKVTLALTRIREGSNVIFAQAVIPQIYRRNPAVTSDLDVFAADGSASDLAVAGWEASIHANRMSLNALLGLALGIHYLEARNGPMAKLLLCKSRSDLRNARDLLLNDSPQSEQDLLVDIDELLRQAEPMAASASTAIDASLRQQIKLACADSMERP
jgi:hypothetical protein